MRKRRTLSTFYVQPNSRGNQPEVVDRRRAGASGIRTVELIQAIDLSTQPRRHGCADLWPNRHRTGTEFAQATIKGSGNA